MSFKNKLKVPSFKSLIPELPSIPNINAFDEALTTTQGLA